ncbi:MAG: hypothetical protein NTZ74_12975 [Chloroflexi bacterium]|nr:hypothetical protein [Chloroflexota bacterium]
MRLLRHFSEFCLVLSLTLLVISFLKPTSEKETLPFTAENGQKGKIILTIPSEIHSGDESEISLEVNLDADISTGSSPAALSLISRFEIGGLAIAPHGEIRATLDPGERMFFSWRVSSPYEEIFTGKLWLFSGQESGGRDLLFAREVILRSHQLLGYTFRQVRIFLLIFFLVVFLLSFGLFRRESLLFFSKTLLM